jgi:hypothetical protein
MQGQAIKLPYTKVIAVQMRGKSISEIKSLIGL